MLDLCPPVMITLINSILECTKHSKKKPLPFSNNNINNNNGISFNWIFVVNSNIL